MSDLVKPRISESEVNSRARVPTDKEDRVVAIMGMMPHSWVKGKTGAELALLWGCSEGVIAQCAAEAWRRLKAVDPVWVRGHLAAELETTLAEAKTIDELPARTRAVVDIVRAWAPLVGAQAPTQSIVALVSSDEWQRTKSVMLAALEPYPEARQAVVAALLAQSEARGAPQLVEAVEATPEVADAS